MDSKLGFGFDKKVTLLLVHNNGVHLDYDVTLRWPMLPLSENSVWTSMTASYFGSPTETVARLSAISAAYSHLLVDNVGDAHVDVDGGDGERSRW